MTAIIVIMIAIITAIIGAIITAIIGGIATATIVVVDSIQTFGEFVEYALELVIGVKFLPPLSFRAS